MANAEDVKRDPVLNQCDEEIAAVLKKYGKAIRPVAYVDLEGKIKAQVVYMDAAPDVPPGAPEPEKEPENKDNLVTPEEGTA